VGRGGRGGEEVPTTNKNDKLRKLLGLLFKSMMFQDQLERNGEEEGVAEPVECP